MHGWHVHRFLRVAAAVVALAATAACSGPAALGVAPSTSQSAPPPVLPTGIVALVTGPAGPSLRLFDAGSGRQVRSVALPTDQVSAAQFSPDWSWLAWLTPNNALAVAELRGDAYVQTATVVAAQLKTSAGLRLTHTQFLAATGQLVVAYNAPNSDPPIDGGLVVDPGHLDAKPVRGTTDLSRDVDRYGDPSQPTRAVIANQPTLRLEVFATKRELISAEILDPPVTVPDGEKSNFAYVCDGPALDDSQIACRGDTEVGALALLTRRTGSDVATLRQLIDPGNPPIKTVLPSPDRTRLLVERTDGWVVARTDESGPPRPAFHALQTGQSEKVSILAWI